MIEAKCILASSAEDREDLITLQLRAPKFLDSEFEKHRMISSNSSSDRAIPWDKMKNQEFFTPWDIRFNEKGMQGYEQVPEQTKIDFCEAVIDIRNITIDKLSYFKEVHKQHLNRYLLPWSMQSKIATATRDQWEYFLKLRLSPDADPAMQQLARCIKDELDLCIPNELAPGMWHLPYITEEDWDREACNEVSEDSLKLASAARCARVSGNNHDGSVPILSNDLELANNTLLAKGHMTPFEHQASPMPYGDADWVLELNKSKGHTHVDVDGYLWSANFKGWIQYRQTL